LQVLSTSKVYHPRPKTKNVDDSTISKLVNDSDVDMYEDGYLPLLEVYACTLEIEHKTEK
jgi:hypothetical protein